MPQKRASHFFRDDEILSTAVGSLPPSACGNDARSSEPLLFSRRKGRIQDWNVSTTHLLPLLLMSVFLRGIREDSLWCAGLYVFPWSMEASQASCLSTMIRFPVFCLQKTLNVLGSCWRDKDEFGGGETSPMHRGVKAGKFGMLLSSGFRWFWCCWCWDPLVLTPFEVNSLHLGLLDLLPL